MSAARASSTTLLALVLCACTGNDDEGQGDTQTNDEQGTSSSSAGTSESSGSTGTSESSGEATTALDTSDSSDSDSTTGDELPEGCLPDVFDHAPPPTTIDGLPAVPIDVLSLDAQLSFDAGAQSAQAESTLVFQLGADGGMPIFDLRQAITAASLDGAPLGSGQYALHDFGRGIDAGFRILEVELEPCSIHTLELSHAIAQPNAPLSGGLTYASAPARLYFDVYMSDLQPGRYLESWLPANLPFDRHPISLQIELVNAEVQHDMIANVPINGIGATQWQLEFPDTTRAMSPLIVLVPSEEISALGGIHDTNGQALDYRVYRNVSVDTPIEAIELELLAALDEFALSSGPFVHESMAAYVGVGLRSMEYAGALTAEPDNLRHEVFHSWWARGVLPATYADGWIDEAWTMYNTTPGFSLTSEPFEPSDPPVLLFDPHPFARDTPDAAYVEGRSFFAGLAAIVGVEPLRDAMAELYLAIGPHGSLTTAMLERHLYCTTGELPELRQAFWRYVYGQVDAVPSVDPDYCA